MDLIIPLTHTTGMYLAEFQDTFHHERLPEYLKGLLICLLQALGFLHAEANVMHTGIHSTRFL